MSSRSRSYELQRQSEETAEELALMRLKTKRWLWSATNFLSTFLVVWLFMLWIYVTTWLVLQYVKLW